MSNQPPIPMQDQVDAFLEWMQVTNFSPRTIEGRQVYLRAFLAWCEERDLLYAAQITTQVLYRYQRHVYHMRKADGNPYSLSSQAGRLSTLKAFFKWLRKQRRLKHNPAADLDMPRAEYHLPKHILSVREIEKVMSRPDLDTPLGLRDRAIMETIYSTGMRRSALVRLAIHDVDAERGLATLRQAKGKKDRAVPIGQRAIAWIEKYRYEARGALVIEPDDGTLFLTQNGCPMSKNRVTDLVAIYIDEADLGKHGGPHLLRHSMATQMLEGGADIRYIQHILGHARLDSTQIYTRVAIRKLKEVHEATHPAANLKRTPPPPEIPDPTEPLDDPPADA